MQVDWQTVFVVGPPAAGKSTIGRAVAEQMEVTFRTIDDWTPPSESMTDTQVEHALARLFEATSGKNEIVEFCHHDYEGLLESDAYPIFGTGRKVLVTAPMSLCTARNRLRRSPVRETYVERAWHSTQSLINRCSTSRPNQFIVLDTSEQSIGAAVAAVMGFLMTEKGRLI